MKNNLVRHRNRQDNFVKLNRNKIIMILLIFRFTTSHPSIPCSIRSIRSIRYSTHCSNRCRTNHCSSWGRPSVSILWANYGHSSDTNQSIPPIQRLAPPPVSANMSEIYEILVSSYEENYI